MSVMCNKEINETELFATDSNIRKALRVKSYRDLLVRDSLPVGCLFTQNCACQYFSTGWTARAFTRVVWNMHMVVLCIVLL